MGEFIIWTWLICGTPFALALIQRAAEWLRDAIHARTIAREAAAGRGRASDSSLLWMHG
jgi:hypothetical protein